MNDLPIWLQKELDERGWTQADLVRASKGRLTTAQVSRVMSGQQNAGVKFCQGVAFALDVTPDTILRHVGILTNYDPKTAKAKEVQRILENSSPQVVDDVLEFARHRLSLAKKRGEYHAKDQK